MNRMCWRLVEISSRILRADERDAVLGDLAESGETARQALRQLLGLAVRRHAALWRDWRPWLAFVALIVPLGMLLSIVSRLTADESATYVWLYANNWDWNLLKDAGFWYEFAASLTLVLVKCLTLVCLSWTTGFVLGSISGTMARVYSILFCLMLVFGGLLAAPRYFAYMLQFVYHRWPSDPLDPVFALVFYREMLPLIVQAALVAVPSLWGIRQGADVRTFPPWLRVIVWTAATGTLTQLVLHEPGFVFFLKAYWLQRIWQSWQLRGLQLVVYWPVAHWAASAIFRRRHGHGALYEPRSA